MPRILIPSIKPLLDEKRKWCALFSGLLLGLATPGIGWWVLAWIAMVPALLALLNVRSIGDGLAQGFLFGLGYYVLVFAWFLGLYPLSWLGVSPVTGVLITVLGWGTATVTQALLIMLLWGLLTPFIRAQKQTLWLLAPLWVAGLWVLNLHVINPLGLPWGFLAYTQAGLPWVRESAFTLTFWGLEGLIVTVNIALALAFSLRKPSVLVPGGLAIMLILTAGRLASPYPSKTLANLNAVAIQGNVTMEAEHLFLDEGRKYDYYHQLIAQLPASTLIKPKLILLPEGVIHEESRVSGPFLKMLAYRPYGILSGGTFQQNGAVYNGVLFMPPESTGIRRFGKRVLVPFGETTPLLPLSWASTLSTWLKVDLTSSFAAGLQNQPPFKLGNIKLYPLVCFEALYPTLVPHETVANNGVIVTFGNLGWYHQNPILEKQFLAFNQFRASEAGVPLIVVTNTGQSAFISERGDILSLSQSGQANYLTRQNHGVPFSSVDLMR